MKPLSGWSGQCLWARTAGFWADNSGRLPPHPGSLQHTVKAYFAACLPVLLHCTDLAMSKCLVLAKVSTTMYQTLRVWLRSTVTGHFSFTYRPHKHKPRHARTHTFTVGTLICEDKSIEAHLTRIDECCLSLRGWKASCSIATNHCVLAFERKKKGGDGYRGRNLMRGMQNWYGRSVLFLWCMNTLPSVSKGVKCVCLIAHQRIQDCLHRSSQRNREKPSYRAENTKPITTTLNQALRGTCSNQFTGWQMRSPFMLIKGKLYLQNRSKFLVARAPPQTHMANVLPWSQVESGLRNQMQGTFYRWRKRERHTRDSLKWRQIKDKSLKYLEKRFTVQH